MSESQSDAERALQSDVLLLLPHTIPRIREAHDDENGDDLPPPPADQLDLSNEHQEPPPDDDADDADLETTLGEFQIKEIEKFCKGECSRPDDEIPEDCMDFDADEESDHDSGQGDSDWEQDPENVDLDQL